MAFQNKCNGAVLYSMLRTYTVALGSAQLRLSTHLPPIFCFTLSTIDTRALWLIISIQIIPLQVHQDTY